METTSRDGQPIHYDVAGTGPTALVFVHGWLGRLGWWDHTRANLAPAYTVVALDLAGHGASGQTRVEQSIAAYADDVLAVVRAVAAPRVVLVGHSMAGAVVLAAAPGVERLDGIILIDTLKDLDAPPPPSVDTMLALYRRDFASAVRTILPRFLFAPGTPPAVVAMLSEEFLAVDGDRAAALLAPLYRFDARAAAADVRVPVRAIGGDLHPTNAAANRRYLADYDYVDLAACGHYPMLEQPDAFVAALRAALVATAPR